MNFKELCQMTARESGTVSGVLPATVADQTGRLAKIVNWTNESWRQIQLLRSSWLWMRGEFSGSITTPAYRYTAAALSVSRVLEWIHENRDDLTIYETAEGVADENSLRYISWQDYRRQYMRGTQTEDRPIEWAISPSNELCFGPHPDTAYTIQGEIRKSPQTLSEDTDTPELPASYHEIIAWNAVLLLQKHDEAQIPIATATGEYRKLIGFLERDQLPQITIGGALA